MAERPSLAALCTSLRMRIRDGRLAPGARLIETELAHELETTRAPLREAIMLLAGERLLDLTPHKGARVRALDTAEAEERMRARCALAGVLASLATQALACADDAVRAAKAAPLSALQTELDAAVVTDNDACASELDALEDRYLDVLSTIACDAMTRHALATSLLPHERPAGSEDDFSRFLRSARLLTDAVLGGFVPLADTIARDLVRRG